MGLCFNLRLEAQGEAVEGCNIASVLALTEDSQITKMVRVCGHEDAGMHLAVS
jgi:hypothetical protein